MEAAYVIRKQQLLEECQVAPEIFHQVMPRLETFMAPFVDTCCRQEPSQHAQTYVCGLLSDVERKNVESIAYRFGQDRLPLQKSQCKCTQRHESSRSFLMDRKALIMASATLRPSV